MLPWWKKTAANPAPLPSYKKLLQLLLENKTCYTHDPDSSRLSKIANYAQLLLSNTRHALNNPNPSFSGLFYSSAIQTDKFSKHLDSSYTSKSTPPLRLDRTPVF